MHREFNLTLHTDSAMTVAFPPCVFCWYYLGSVSALSDSSAMSHSQSQCYNHIFKYKVSTIKHTLQLHENFPTKTFL